ncbi:MAG TPA: extracellular solute-binding protein, partial [Candidatus Limnocylindria bacterium]|nr:extracellular solute-binding protein [Candidatus Limnocylindria bacterium]
MPDQRQSFDIAFARALARGMTQRRLSRRVFLRQAGVAGSALSIPAILAACGIPAQSPSPAVTGTPAAPTPGATPAATPAAPAGQLIFANWPLYIDIDDETGDYPTLQEFQQRTGINVSYSEDINDNEEFFGRIQPDLAAGNPTGFDLIVMTDWMIERMIRLGYLEELGHAALPTVEENMQDLYRNPWYDPGNRYSVAWQSGITGIGYDPELTGREITTFDDLLDPA